MEETPKELQKNFEGYTKQERKLLRKGFHKEVELRFKVFLWGGIALLLAGIVSGAFSLYYMLNILFTRFFVFQFYIYTTVFTVGCGASMLLTEQYHKQFRVWLKEKTLL